MLKNSILQLVNLFKKYKLLFILLLSTFFIFVSTFCYPIIYFATAILVVAVIFLDFNEIICMFVYQSMLGCFLVPLIASTIAGFVAIIVKYIIAVKHKEIQFLKVPFILTTIICVLFSSIIYTFDYYTFYEGLMVIAFLYLGFFFVSYRKNLKIKKYFDYLFLGLIVSVCSLLLFYIFPSAKTMVYSDQSFVMQSMIDKMLMRDTDYSRNVLLSFHVNHLATFCLLMIAYSLVYLIKYKCNIEEYVYYGSMLLLSIVIGITTLSKAFIIIFIFEICLVLLYFVIKHKKQSLKLILAIIIVALPLAFIFRNQFITLFERFFQYSNDTILSMLTTGRSGIWQKYANAILESPLKLLVGFGLFSAHEVFIGPHNLYIFLLYRFGLIGILLLGLLIYSYIKSLNIKLKINVKNAFIFIVFLVIGLQETCIDERFYFFFIGLLLMFEKDNEKRIRYKEDSYASRSIS